MVGIEIVTYFVVNELSQRSHLFFDLVIVIYKTIYISLGQNAFNSLFVIAFHPRRVQNVLVSDYNKGRNIVFFAQNVDVFESCVLRYAYRRRVNESSRSFDFLDFETLVLDRHESVQYAQSAFSGHLDCHFRLCDCIHG